MKRILRASAVLWLAAALLMASVISAQALISGTAQLVTANGKTGLAEDLSLSIAVTAGKENRVFVSGSDQLRRSVVVHADGTAEVRSTSNTSKTYGAVTIASLLEAEGETSDLQMTIAADGSHLYFSKLGGEGNRIPLAVAGTGDEIGQFLENVQGKDSLSFQFEPAAAATSAVTVPSTESKQSGLLTEPGSSTGKTSSATAAANQTVAQEEVKTGESNGGGVQLASLVLLVLLLLLIPALWLVSNAQSKKNKQMLEEGMAEQKKMLQKHEEGLEDIQARVGALRAKIEAPKSDFLTSGKAVPAAPAEVFPKPVIAEQEIAQPEERVLDRCEQLNEALKAYYKNGEEAALAPFGPVRVEFDAAVKVRGVQQRLNRVSNGEYIVLEDSMLIPSCNIFDGDNITATYLKQKCNMQLFFTLKGKYFRNSQITKVLPATVQLKGDHYEQTAYGLIEGS